MTLEGLGDEEQACKAFDAALSGDPRFSTVYHEVSGRYLHPSPFDVDRQPRIDRILIPSRDLSQSGWMHGPIGVEIKASGKKIGKALAQCIDYTRASFEIRPGFFIPVGFVFLFPARPLGGDLESIAVQNRVGTCTVSPYGEVVFFRGASKVASIEEPHRNFIPQSKVGSR